MRPLLAALALVLLGAAPAGAETWHGSDPVGDADLITHDTEPPPCGTTTHATAPDDVRHDLTELTVRHAASTITLGVSLRQVRAHDAHTTVSFMMRTAAREYLLTASSRGRKPVQPYLTPIPRHLGPPDVCGSTFFSSAGADCPGLAAHRDVRRDRVEVTVPRSCVGEPRWVEVAAQVFDDARTAGTTSTATLDQWATPTASGQPVAYSPRVRRG